MHKEYSPFTPGRPVPVEFFVGRQQEIQELVTRVRKVVAQRTVEAVFVEGEIGIGKSSLCHFAKHLVEIHDNGKVCSVHVHLGGVASLEEMVQAIFEKLLEEINRDQTWFQKVKEFFGKHIKQADVFGVTFELKASQKELSSLARNFAPVLKDTLQRSGGRKGYFLILDDINGLVQLSQFAHWLKSLVDSIATSSDPLPLVLALIGPRERRFELIKRQPSLARVFAVIPIEKFSQDEVRQFYDRAFRKVNARVESKAHKIFWKYSGGHPAFMHEIGDATFRFDKDNVISEKDALGGVIRAAQAIGSKYIEPNVLAAIQSERYRGILHAIVKDGPVSVFSKSEIARKIPEDQKKVLNNFLQRMKKLNVLRNVPEGERGRYEFTSQLYSLFFWIHAERLQRQSWN